MSTYNTPTDVTAATLARSTSVNDVDAATATAFGLLPTNEQINRDTTSYAVDTGTANAYLVALPKTATSYVDGMLVAFKPAYSCTGASTVNVDSLGVKSIKLASGDATATGNIIAAIPVEMRYSSTTGYFYLQGTSGVAGPAGSLSGTAIGVVDLLTGANIASASTINLDTATGNRVHVTGTVTITAVTLTRGPRTVIFDDALTLTHHATNNKLPGGVNITTAAGDVAIYEGDGTTVRCVSYVKASGRPVIDDFQEFTSSGTWTKPSGAPAFVLVELDGAGAGGGSGRRGAAGTDRYGGGAGGGGAHNYRLFKASDLGATVTVTIGAGGTGGAAIAVDDTNGNDGTAGGDSTFGTHLTATGGTKGEKGLASSGISGAGGSSLSAGGVSVSAAGAGGNLAYFGGGGGAAGGAAVAPAGGPGGSSQLGGAGGGGGGGISSANTSGNGGAGGAQANTSGGAAGTQPGGAGTAGTSGAGGGGGGAGGAAAGGAGGAGAAPGGGGGGGGASLNGQTSGAGGAGGAGRCRVYTW